MPNISGTSASDSAYRPDQQPIPTDPNKTGSPQSPRREIPSTIIHRAKRDEPENLYGTGQVPAASQERTRADTMAAIEHHMRTICAAEQASAWKPVAGVLYTLNVLKEHVSGATEAEKQAIIAALHNITSSANAHRDKDVALLKTAIDRTLQGEDPADILGKIAEESLKLPNFSLRAADQVEPSQRDFDSTLLPFAAAAYDYGPLGRTLLLEGACHCFAGPRQKERGEELHKIIFALPNPPASGEPLDNMWDIRCALFELKFDV